MLIQLQKFIFAECKVCARDIHQTKYGGRQDVGVRKFVTNAQNPNFAVCSECGFTASVNNLIAKEVEEIGLEEMENG